MDQFPPLKALVVLDATMRHSSFSLAADELCVTPGAVGQQIQKLEEWLGVPLFRRQIRQVQPTAEGLSYWRSIQPALAQIVDASRKLKNQSSKSVRLSMPPGFAAKWFPRRMAGFLTRHPDVELHFNSTTALIDFERDAIDLAIRYFDGRDQNLDATLLWQDEARVYCRPDYAASLSLQRADDLCRATLLDTTMQPFWRQWMREFSTLDDARIAAIPCLHFDQSLMAIEAAKQGQGVVMCSPILVEEETAQGILVEPFEHSLPVSNGYYVIHHRRLPIRPAAQALKAWLIEQAKPPERMSADTPLLPKNKEIGFTR